MINEDNQEEQSEQEDKSLVTAAAATFTLKWFVQTVAAWGFSMWLTKMYNKWKERKQEKKDARK